MLRPVTRCTPDVRRRALAGLVASIELVYEATASGLMINIPKCRLGPTTRARHLGMVIDSRLYVHLSRHMRPYHSLTPPSRHAHRRIFRLPASRVERITLQVRELAEMTRAGPASMVTTKNVTQLVGLLWAICPCCPRAVAIQARGLVGVLTDAMEASVWSSSRAAVGKPRPGRMPMKLLIKRLLSRFWRGEVRWSRDAANELRFWSSVDFSSLRAPISQDSLEVLVAGALSNPAVLSSKQVGFLASDASDTACGGGIVSRHPQGFVMDHGAIFFSALPGYLRRASSSVREATAILWMLQSLWWHLPPHIIVFTDSRTAALAIRRGSRTRALHAVAREIFVWSMRRGVVVMPCWSPRSSTIIAEADRRSRWRDPHDSATPPEVFRAANNIAVSTWGRPISFDRQASHLNVMPPPGMGPSLPFNSLWHQPGSHGVDMFLQPRWSWQSHINFIHPARPTVGRVLAFLPATASRAVVVFPAYLASGAWWSPYASVGGPGIVHSVTLNSFLILAVDHSPSSPMACSLPRVCLLLARVTQTT